MTTAADLTFGIEIETTIPAGLIPVGAYHHGLQVPGLPEGWVAMRDASIRARGGRVGCEFVSPILKGADGIRQVLEVVRKLKEMGAQVNESCGFHVHVGFSGDNAARERLVTLVANFEKAIYAQTGTKRRESGNWCRSLQQHGDAARAEQNASAQRYHVLNLTNLASGRRPAVEFRAFAGTLNPTKIIGHIFTCLGLVERAIVAKRTTNFVAKETAPTSPIHRNGAGQTALTRLYYQLGWVKGRTNRTYGVLPAEIDLPSIRKQLMELARKYDRQ